MIGQLFAGVGLGLLVGVLVGLSSSPVVSVVVGALASGMVTLLGFVQTKSGDVQQSEGSAMRLGGFGLACTTAIMLGLYVRTHDFASPSIADQVAEVQRAGYSAEQARRWVAYKNVGAILDPGSGSEGNGHAAPARGTEAVAGSVLFSGEDSGECQHFDTGRYKDVSEHLYSLRQSGGRYAEYAEKISTLDTARQKSVLDSLRLLACPQ